MKFVYDHQDEDGKRYLFTVSLDDFYVIIIRKKDYIERGICTGPVPEYIIDYVKKLYTEVYKDFYKREPIGVIYLGDGDDESK